MESRYFNPRSPHGERLPVAAHQGVALLISTHAPRTGSDLADLALEYREEISTHAPRTGSDYYLSEYLSGLRISTHAPRTGSDLRRGLPKRCAGYFNPRSPHGERQDGDAGRERAEFAISTHAPRTGSDNRVRHLLLLRSKISTHAPRTGSDITLMSRTLCLTNFNPRSPHGERPVSEKDTADSSHFNPRSPHGERQPRLSLWP